MFASRSIPAGPPMNAGCSGDDFLTCRMCLVPFSHANRLPLALNCLHTFCEHCVTAWTQNKTKMHKLTCPLCKKVTKMERGVKPKDALPINRAVLELVAVTGMLPFGPTPSNNCMPLTAPQVSYLTNNQNFTPAPCGQNTFVMDTNPATLPILMDTTNINPNSRLTSSMIPNANKILGFPPSLGERIPIANEYPNLTSLNNVSQASNGWIDTPSSSVQQTQSMKQLQNDCYQPPNSNQFQSSQCQPTSFPNERNCHLNNDWDQPRQSNCCQEQPQSQQRVFLDKPSNKWDKQPEPSCQQKSFSKERGYKQFGRKTPFANASSCPESVVKKNQNCAVQMGEHSSSSKDFVSNVSIGDVRGHRSAQIPLSNACVPLSFEHKSNDTSQSDNLKPVNSWNAPMAEIPLISVNGKQQPLTFQVGSQATHGGMTATTQQMQSRGDTDNLMAGTAITALSINSSAGLSSSNVSVNRRNIEPATAFADISSNDLCTNCFLHPAKISIASSKAMKAQKLCTTCHTEKISDKRQTAAKGGGDCGSMSVVTQQLNKGDQSSPSSKPKVDANSATNIRKKTVIKVHDDKTTPLADRFQREAGSNADAEWFQNAENNAIPEAQLIRSSMIKLDGPVRINANTKDIFLNHPKSSNAGRTSLERISPVPTQQTISNPPITSEMRIDSKNLQEQQIQSSSTRIDLSATLSSSVRDRLRHGNIEKKTSNEVRTNGIRFQNKERKQAEAFLREYVVNPSKPNLVNTVTDIGCSKDLIMPQISSTVTPNAPQLESEYETRRPEAYNPQFVESNVEWSSHPVMESTHQPLEQTNAAQTKHQEAMYQQGTASMPVVSVGSGWNNTINGASEKAGPYPPEGNSGSYQPSGAYPTLRAPPAYEEIMGTAPGVIQSNLATVGGSLGQQSHTGNARCIGRFGKYGEVSTQPGAFRSPTKLGFTSPKSPNMSSNSIEDKVVVVDQANMTVQVFSGSTGECLSLIRVTGAGGACLLSDGNLVVSTPRGVELYNANGVLIKSVSMNGVLNVFRYLSGFIAVQPRALVIFKDATTAISTARTLSTMSKPGHFRHPVPFQDITDAAVNSQQDLVVLDGGVIYTLTADGFIKSVTSPNQEQCSALKQPTAITVDRSHNIIVSDTGNQRVLLFGANGKYQRTLYDGRSTGSPSGQPGRPTWPMGLDVNGEDQLFVVIQGEKLAEVIVLAYTI